MGKLWLYKNNTQTSKNSLPKNLKKKKKDYLNNFNFARSKNDDRRTVSDGLGIDSLLLETRVSTGGDVS